MKCPKCGKELEEPKIFYKGMPIYMCPCIPDFTLATANKDGTMYEEIPLKIKKGE